MNPVIYMNCNLKNRYNKNTFFSKIKDNLSTAFKGERFIQELNLTISQIKFPPNFNPAAYKRNVERARGFIKGRYSYISPKTLRVLDYEVLSCFQKQLIAYSVVKSIQLILRNSKKSIKSSCILVYDSTDSINRNIIYELSKAARFVILLSENIKRNQKIQDYVMGEFGISPVVTNDFKYAVNCADFIVSSRNIDFQVKAPVWYMDNGYNPANEGGLIINDVDYKVPWDIEEFSNMPPELLGAILGQMQEKDIEKSLKTNGIYLDGIKYNDRIIGL
jgi:hypothetical protein